MRKAPGWQAVHVLAPEQGYGRVSARYRRSPYLSPASARVSSPAPISLQPLAFCPAHKGEKSPFPRLSARARKGAGAAAASGNCGACAFIGPSSRIRRLTIPRAGRPVKRLVSAVTRADSRFSAARWIALTSLSGAPEDTPEAHEARADVLADPRTQALLTQIVPWEVENRISGHHAPTFAPNLSLRTRTAGLANHHWLPAPRRTGRAC